VFILRGEITLHVYAPKVEDEHEACHVYNEAYAKAYDEGIMTTDETLEWMVSKELWKEEDEERISGLQEDLEHLRVEIFNNRENEGLAEEIRKGIRKGEEQLKEQIDKKGEFIGNTCEGIASIEKARYQIRTCTYLNGGVYDFSSIGIDEVLSANNRAILKEGDVRDLALNEPWKVAWYMKDVQGYTLFPADGRELTPDQKNLVIWSKMYDNVSESMESPPDDVVKDHDMLDGWFIVQRKKREKDKAEKEFDGKLGNDKISGADEVFVMAKGKKHRKNIHEMNDATAKMHKKQRSRKIHSKGSAGQDDFMDVKLNRQQASHEQYKDKFRR
tara:strand:+ start:4483 stop:5472 length:990 start_codon:yes stop_codon:yes gene_type:complete